MKLRTQLVLAFLLLAVVPLGAITLYSYESSARALRRTVEAESSRMAGELNNRMGVVTANLSRRIDMLESVPFPETGGGPHAPGEEPDPMLVGRLVAALGETASFIDSFEFTPTPAPPAPPEGANAGGGHAPARRQPIVIPLPRIVGELAKDPKLQPVIRLASSFLSAEDAGRIKQELDDRLGRGGDDILKVVKERIRAEVEARRAAAGKEKLPEPRAALALKQEFGCPLKRNGQTVGHLKAKVSADRLLREVLSQTKREQGEIPFALDASGRLFTPDQADVATLRGLEQAAASGQANTVSKGGVRDEAAVLNVAEDDDPAGVAQAASRGVPEDPHAGDHNIRIGVSPDENWVVVTREDAVTGLVFGIARPVGAALGDIRRASARNLGAGLVLAALALFGIVPISRRMTHNLSDLTLAAGELAAGRLDTQVPVRSRDELGQLAQAFNRMARDLQANQERLVEQERLRKELELCRRIQNELLPKKPLLYPFAELQGLSIPAHELGGDFFNYFELPGGEVALFMGDVSGKGVPAALLMANLQATLKARIPLETDLSAFARQLDRDVEASTPPEVYLTLFLGILDPAQRVLRYVNAGHESPFLLRRDGRLERLDPTGRPIGLMSGGTYTEKSIGLEPGDRLFLYTDGLVDAENEAGAVFGPARLETLLSGERATGPADLLARVEQAYQDHRGLRDAADDATLLVLKVGDWTATRVETQSETVVPPPIVRGPFPSATI
jgi:serine phosphatase RsbU (regulator of sigma subunit)